MRRGLQCRCYQNTHLNPGLQTTSHGDESGWDTQTDQNEFYVAKSTHAIYPTEGKQKMDTTSRGILWDAEYLVDFEHELPQVAKYPGRWGTANLYDGVMPDWLNTRALEPLLREIGKPKMANMWKQFDANVLEGKLYNTSDFCPQGPSGPDF